MFVDVLYVDSGVFLFFFFFFQAEDGIRDIGVTGVQTCALPIYQENHASQSGTQSLKKHFLLINTDYIYKEDVHECIFTKEDVHDVDRKSVV